MNSLPHYKNLAYLSFTSLLLIYITMLFGVYLSSISQPVNCQQWPLCPNGLFNFPSPSYIIEYLHRVLAFSSAAGICILAIYTYSKIKKIRFLCITAVLLVIVQVSIGMFVATTQVIPLASAGHLSIGVTLFGLVLLVFLFSKGLLKKTSRFMCD
jgi:heme A synthase